MRSCLYVASVFFVGLTLVTACSDDDIASSSSSSGSVGSSSGSTSSGTSGQNGSTSSSSGASANGLDLNSLISIKVTSDWCQRPPNQCLDAQSFFVDFVNSKLTTSTCVEVAGTPNDAGISPGGTQSANTSRDLTADDLTTLKTQLAALQLTSTAVAAVDAGFDPYGQSKRLEVTTKTGGTVDYATTDGACGNAKDLVDGWQKLYDTVRGL